MNECQENCPVAGRVDALEKEFDRYRSNSTDTHRQMFDRIGALEQSGMALRTKLDSIEEKLDELNATVKALASRPGRRWAKAMETGLVAIVTGVVCFLLGRIGF